MHAATHAAPTAAALAVSTDSLPPLNAALEAEAAYREQVRQERDGAYALIDAELSGYDPVHERQLALTRQATAAGDVS
jgi:hypothetical protein